MGGLSDLRRSFGSDLITFEVVSSAALVTVSVIVTIVVLVLVTEIAGSSAATTAGAIAIGSTAIEAGVIA